MKEKEISRAEIQILWGKRKKNKKSTNFHMGLLLKVFSFEIIPKEIGVVINYFVHLKIINIVVNLHARNFIKKYLR